MKAPSQHASRPREEGYLLLGLVVVCFLIVLFLGVAAPRVAKQLEREREVETEHRALEYVRAIKLYHDKTQGFPSSVDQLLGGGASGISTTAAKVKYLRQQYKDPLTGDDFRLIHLGEAQTQVKGFFGEALQGTAQGSLGSIAGMASGIGTGAGSTASAGGAAASTGSTLSFGNSFSSGASGSATQVGTAGTAENGTNTSGGLTSTSATSFQGSKGAIVGVGSNAKGKGLVEWNGSEDISQWEFLYDPRVEVLKAKVSIFGGTPAASGTGSLGANQGSISAASGNFGGTSTSAAGTSTTGSSFGGTVPAGTISGSTAGATSTGTTTTNP